MGSNYLTDPVEFLIHTLVGLYILIVMLRFLLQWVRADFYNPLSQFIVKATNPPLRPLRRVIPGLGGVDLASLLLMLILQMLVFALIGWMRDASFGFGALLFLALGELVSLALNVFIFAIIIQVILSWINPGHYNPITGVLYSLTRPLMQPARRLIPPMGGLDFSPLVVLLALQIMKMLLLPPIQHLARVVG